MSTIINARTAPPATAVPPLSDSTNFKKALATPVPTKNCTIQVPTFDRVLSMLSYRLRPASSYTHSKARTGTTPESDTNPKPKKYMTSDIALEFGARRSVASDAINRTIDTTWISLQAKLGGSLGEPVKTYSEDSDLGR